MIRRVTSRLCLPVALLVMVAGIAIATPVDEMVAIVRHFKDQVRQDATFEKLGAAERHAIVIEAIRLLGYTVGDEVVRDSALALDERRLAEAILAVNSPEQAARVATDLANLVRSSALEKRAPGPIPGKVVAATILGAPVGPSLVSGQPTGDAGDSTEDSSGSEDADGAGAEGAGAEGDGDGGGGRSGTGTDASLGSGSYGGLGTGVSANGAPSRSGSAMVAPALIGDDTRTGSLEELLRDQINPDEIVDSPR